MSAANSVITQLQQSLLSWVDNGPHNEQKTDTCGLAGVASIDWVRVVPFLALHASCLLVFMVGWSPTAIGVALGSYLIRMFAITGFYHRYFSHRSFKTTRGLQFVFAILGASATQRGPIWWASHHRHHHVNSDTDQDSHSPRRGFWWSHVGWFLTREQFSNRPGRVRDLRRYPELLWLDRFDSVVPLVFGAALYFAGEVLATRYPDLGTDGLQLFVWGYLISTVFLLHVTLFINSAAHKFGSRRFNTNDDSRNNLYLALLTLGEGWHNNHHFYPVSVRQGFYWWEIDITFYVLKCMAWLGLVWDLKMVPENKLQEGLTAAGERA